MNNYSTISGNLQILVDTEEAAELVEALLKTHEVGLDYSIIVGLNIIKIDDQGHFSHLDDMLIGINGIDGVTINTAEITQIGANYGDIQNLRYRDGLIQVQKSFIAFTEWVDC